MTAKRTKSSGDRAPRGVRVGRRLSAWAKPSTRVAVMRRIIRSPIISSATAAALAAASLAVAAPGAVAELPAGHQLDV